MTKFDRHIKSCLMNNRTHEDVLSTGDIGTTIEAIQGLFTSECRNIQGPNNGGGSEGQKNNDGEKKNNPGAEDQSYTDAERVAFEVYPSCTFEQLQPWALIAERNVRRWTQIHTIPEADTEAELRKIIEGSEIGKLRGTPSEPIAIIYDPKLTGESITRPRIRLPPFKEESCRACVRAVLSSRENPTEIHPGDVYAFFDGGKTGLSSSLVRCGFCLNRMKLGT